MSGVEFTRTRLRRHQREALDALENAWAAGRNRAWVVLPPGAGKTLVGLETVRRRLAGRAIDKAVVLGPNTAIQGQWLAQAESRGIEAGADRSLEHVLTALTYQAVAIFDPDAEITDDAEAVEGGPLMARLHDNGRALVAALREAGPILLVLDECHHLLEVWGQLLAELLDELPEAQVLGLTATPPQALTPDQAQLVAALFGEVVYETSIPAVVREGDLAPFAELAWLTTPTPHEADWLATEATRFRELTTQLTDLSFGSVPFLTWLDRRFVQPVGARLSWATLTKQFPDLCRAALRMHHAELLDLPEGARMQEEHRHEPTADDWVLLVEDWLREGLGHSEDPDDEEVVAAVRGALPSVGYQWTRRGIRRGRSTVDRVLARSQSKAAAAVEIIGHEATTLGEWLRMLVLCDHERASATLPADLHGVLDRQAGSAWAMLEALVADPMTAPLRPLLVTGKTVAGAPETLELLAKAVVDEEPMLDQRLVVVPIESGVARLDGPWTSRQWVGHVTRFFEAGTTQVLVGTRGLLGEGWDARRVTGLIDLTAVTTTTAVVQTRGRALRIDPRWPDKVAVTWTVVCVAPDHPKGENDWQRLVRKHAGFYGIDDDGDVVDGVAHIDPLFSPYAAPEAAEFGSLNSAMVLRAHDRPAIRDRWRVGEEYDDLAASTVRIVPRKPRLLSEEIRPPEVVPREDLLDVRAGGPPPWHAGRQRWLLLLAAAIALPVLFGAPAVLLVLPIVLVVLAGLTRLTQLAAHGRAVIQEAARPPSVHRVACAVADGLHAAELVSAGAEAVHVELDHEGEYRCLLAGVPEAESAAYATALDEAVSPIATPRYVLPRWVVSDRDLDWQRAVPATRGRVAADGVVWHAVPAILGNNASRAKAYAKAWDHWVGGGTPVFTGSPEGEGILAAQQGSDPFDVSTVMRRQWS